MKRALLIACLLLCARTLSADDGEYEFRGDKIDGWLANRPRNEAVQGATIESQGRVLHLHYQRSGAPSFVHLVPMAGFRRLQIHLRSEIALTLAVSLQDIDRATFSYVVQAPAKQWIELVLEPADFLPDANSPVHKSRLDPTQLGGAFAVLDVLGYLDPARCSGENEIAVEYVKIRYTGGAAAVPRDALAPHEWTRTEGNPLLRAGQETRPGGPLVLSVADPCVLFVDAEKKWMMWYTVAWADAGGTRRGIKYAESDDGIAWTPGAGLAFEPAADPEAWDHTEVEAPSVVFHPGAPEERRYMLFYAGANRSKDPPGSSPRSRIGMATSAFGKRFTRLPKEESPAVEAGLLLNAADLFPDHAAAAGGRLGDPEVVLHEGQFHLWCTSAASVEGGNNAARGICTAVSEDGIHWTPAQYNPLGTLGKSGVNDAPQRPCVLWNADRKSFEMWYGGADDAPDVAGRLDSPGLERNLPTRGYWYASSPDGITWATSYTRGREFAWDPSAPGEDQGLIAGASVVRQAGEYRLYFSAHGGQPATVGIGVARGK